MIGPEFLRDIYHVLFFPKQPHDLRCKKRRGLNARQYGPHPRNNSETKTLNDYLLEQMRARDLTVDCVDQSRNIVFGFALHLEIDRAFNIFEKFEDRAKRWNSFSGKFTSGM